MITIGIFSSFAEPDALELVEEVVNFIDQEYGLQATIRFVFSNRGPHENPVTDMLLQALELKLSLLKIPLVMLSATGFEPDRRQHARQQFRQGVGQFLEAWRNDYGEKIANLLPLTDFDLLLGDWLIWGDSLCKARNGINLHPALPKGPKGEWFNVIWQLIRQSADESGVMMHKITPQLDRGPIITYCRYMLHDPDLDDLWQALPENPEELEHLIQTESKKRELVDYPLHRAIRTTGFKREVPLILSTVASLIDGTISLTETGVVDKTGHELVTGYDATSEVEARLYSGARQNPT